jgi:regulator of sigma E protease
MLLNILNILYFIAVCLILFNLTIFIHELGHYLVGKWRGAKIERFAIWFGPAIWKKTINGVEFRLGCIPLGGYVAFPQLAMEAVEGKSETPTEQLPPLKPKDKIPILLAGSVGNIILGFVVATIVWIVGIPTDKDNLNLTMGYIPSTSPIYESGIRQGDRVVRVNGEEVRDWDEVRYQVALSLSPVAHVEVERGGQVLGFDLQPVQDNLFKIRTLTLQHYSGTSTPVVQRMAPESPAIKAGFKVGDRILSVDGEPVLAVAHVIEIVGRRAGEQTRFMVERSGETVPIDVTPLLEKVSKAPKIGIDFGRASTPDEVVLVHPTPLKQVSRSLFAMFDTISALVYTKVTGVGIKDLAGPIGITEQLYLRLLLDYRLALSFLVMLNINLAVVNLLPIPVLDGGHIVFSIIEAIRKRPMSIKFMELTQTVFVVLLLSMMLYITWNDLGRSLNFGVLGRIKNGEPSKELPVFQEYKPEEDKSKAAQENNPAS